MLFIIIPSFNQLIYFMCSKSICTLLKRTCILLAPFQVILHFHYLSFRSYSNHKDVLHWKWTPVLKNHLMWCYEFQWITKFEMLLYHDPNATHNSAINIFIVKFLRQTNCWPIGKHLIQIWCIQYSLYWQSSWCPQCSPLKWQFHLHNKELVYELFYDIHHRQMILQTNPSK
jgi:hypothetical protein